jgi:hypothetical protein
MRYVSATTFNPDDKAQALRLMPVRSRGPGPREARLSGFWQQADAGPHWMQFRCDQLPGDRLRIYGTSHSRAR